MTPSLHSPRHQLPHLHSLATSTLPHTTNERRATTSRTSNEQRTTNKHHQRTPCHQPPSQYHTTTLRQRTPRHQPSSTSQALRSAKCTATVRSLFSFHYCFLTSLRPTPPITNLFHNFRPTNDATALAMTPTLPHTTNERRATNERRTTTNECHITNACRTTNECCTTNEHRATNLPSHHQ